MRTSERVTAAMTVCAGCGGSGSCDVCDGYGDLADGGECLVCDGSGTCPECYGADQ